MENEIIYKEILQKRYNSIDTDDELWADTKPMIPSLKRMLRYGVISTNSQGGIQTKFHKQRPYLDLLLPILIPDGTKEIQMVEELSKDFIVYRESFGLILPDKISSTVIKKSTESLKKYVREKTISKPILKGNRKIIWYQIPVTKRKGKTISNFTIGWQERTSTLLSYYMSQEQVRIFYPYMYQLHIICPEWGYDTVKFAEKVASCIGKYYPIVFYS